MTASILNHTGSHSDFSDNLVGCCYLLTTKGDKSVQYFMCFITAVLFEVKLISKSGMSQQIFRPSYSAYFWWASHDTSVGVLLCLSL
jgi:hypothetical protein